MKNNVLKWLGRVGATLLTTIVILVVGLYLVMAVLEAVYIIASGDRRAWFYG